MCNRIVLLVFLLAVAFQSASSDTVRLIVAYCPTDFSGAAAVVDVDPISGNWTVRAHVTLPSSEVFGCVADYDPTFDVAQFDSNTVWLDFISDEGAFLAIDTRYGNTSAVESSSLFFTGFIDFKQFPDGGLYGVSGTVTESGYCSDGCLSWGRQGVAAGDRRYRQLSLIPFKAGADDTSFIDWSAKTVTFQGSYDLRDTPCGPHQHSECLVTLDTVSGELVRATYTPDYQIFKFQRQTVPTTPTTDSSARKGVLSFALGSLCEGRSANWTYQFLDVNTVTAEASLVSCVDPNFVLQEDEWVAAFSPRGDLLATGSGNGDGDDPQLVVFNVSSGKTVLNSRLSGLAKALRAAMGLIFVWTVEFV